MVTEVKEKIIEEINNLSINDLVELLDLIEVIKRRKSKFKNAHRKIQKTFQKYHITPADMEGSIREAREKLSSE
ncbi:MAG: hypothetical protein NTX88_02610 [Candidatus Atribacteria bacterium]|nr:hypothetical protein [Candidatus Atribacteria bacterium]